MGKLAQKQPLTPSEIRSCFLEMMEGRASKAEIADFLIASNPQKLKAPQIVAAIQVMQEKMVSVPELSGCIDTCGTGGDGSSSFNISTAVAFVVAGAGGRVAKHGNRSASSRVGSADVLEALNVPIQKGPQEVIQDVQRTGFGFFFAPNYHPSMKFVAEVRRKLETKTIFNLLGPLVNPARVKRQLIGVSSLYDLELLKEVFLQLPVEHVLIVCGENSFDEISLTAPTYAYEIRQGKEKYLVFHPQDFGFQLCRLSDLRGGDARKNAQIIEGILGGEKGPKRDIVVLNAGAALYIARLAQDIGQGIELAKQALDSGRALKVVSQLRKIRI